MAIDPHRALARARDAADRAFTDRCLIERQTGDEWDDDAGRYIPDWVVVATARCLASTLDTNERIVTVGPTPQTIRTLQIQLHYDTTATIEVGDRFSIVESTNRHLLPEVRRWFVTDIADGSWSATRYLTVQEQLTRTGAVDE